MMKKDNINKLFDHLHGEFDIESPQLGHQQRFLAKLNEGSNTNKSLSFNRLWNWKPVFAVAATIVLCFSLLTIMTQESTYKDLASVSPELSKTQDFFTATLNQELAALDKERTPETEVLITDALKQLQTLESNYEKLKIDLTESGDDKRVIYAMISNFQNRIDILQTVLKNIEDIKQIKANQNENTITI